MTKFDFDLEEAKFELECVEDLLCIYQEFFAGECPICTNLNRTIQKPPNSDIIESQKVLG